MKASLNLDYFRKNAIKLLFIVGLSGVLLYVSLDALLGSSRRTAETKETPIETTAVEDQVSPHEATRFRYDQLIVDAQSEAGSLCPFYFDGQHAAPPEADDSIPVPSLVDAETELTPSEPATPELLSEPVAIYLESSRGRVALSGEVVVREGDTDAAGNVISEITPKGVIVNQSPE